MRTWRADSDAPRGGAPPAGYSRALLYPSAILTLGALRDWLAQPGT